MQFVGILNRFWTATQTEHGITYIDKLCFKLLPNDITFPHLFYTNAKTIKYNKYVFDNTLSETYKFVARDILSKTYSPSYKFSDKSSLITGLYADFFNFINILVELCMGNHVIYDNLVNGANGIFLKITTIPKSYFDINSHWTLLYIKLQKFKLGWIPFILLHKFDSSYNLLQYVQSIKLKAWALTTWHLIHKTWQSMDWAT